MGNKTFKPFEVYGIHWPHPYKDNASTQDDDKIINNNTDKVCDIKTKHMIPNSRHYRKVPNEWLHSNYHYENIVISGGGTKGYSVIGAFKVRTRVLTFRTVCRLRYLGYHVTKKTPNTSKQYLVSLRVY